MLVQRSLGLLVIAFTFSLSCCLGFGQTSGVVISEAAPFFIGNWGEVGKPVTGIPFCADMETTHAQVLADGTRIQQTRTRRVCRDSQGRTRSESDLHANQPNENSRAFLINVTDPVANLNFTLNPQLQTAITFPSNRLSPASNPHPTIVAPRARTQRPAGAVRPSDRSKESLGDQTFEGITATGTRLTNTIAAGTAGNDQPITTTTENWYSSELHVPLLVKRTDPRSGETVMTTKNISREEPDPSLFQIPACYTVTEMQQTTVVEPKQ